MSSLDLMSLLVLSVMVSLSSLLSFSKSILNWFNAATKLFSISGTGCIVVVELKFDMAVDNCSNDFNNSFPGVCPGKVNSRFGNYSTVSEIIIRLVDSQ